MNKYDEIMEKIEVTDEMRARILFHIDEAESKGLFANLSDDPQHTQSDTQDDVQNGLSDDTGLDDIEDSLYKVKTFSDAKVLSEDARFSVSDISTLKKRAAESAYSLYDGEIAEITYTLSSQSVCLRKSPGSDDNSGIYEDYSDKKVIKDAGTEVSLQGNDGKYFLAAWVKKGYSYSIYAENGLSEKEMTQYISETK